MRIGARARRRAVVVATCLVLAWFASHVDWRATTAALRGASLGLVALALASELASVATKGVRWWLFLRSVGSNTPALAVRATFAGAGLSNVVIGHGGDAAKVALVTRALRQPTSRVLATLALDRAWEAFGYGAVLVLTAALTPLPPTIGRLRAAAFGAVAALGVGLALLTRTSPRPLGRLEERAGSEGGAARWSARPGAFLRRFVAALAEFSTPRRSLAAFALSVVVWGTQAATYGFAAAAAGAELGVIGTLVALLTVNLGFAVRTTPGGIGVFQALFVVGSRSFGVPAHTAVAAAILIQAVQILPITLIGLAVAPELLRRAASEPA
jgi:uncharacterized protein (TIRG00374 family)